jgi:hypothetical protein
MAKYISVYPPAHSDTYVKATTKYSTSFWPYYATDPAKSLTGAWGSNAWGTPDYTVSNQRFHIDLGSSKKITKIYYENGHDSGSMTAAGAQNFTFWGSNAAGSFADLTYATDTGWTQLTTFQDHFEQHVALDQADPQYITVTNATAYRYYAFKFANNYGEIVMAVRRIELQKLIFTPQIISF